MSVEVPWYLEMVAINCVLDFRFVKGVSEQGGKYTVAVFRSLVNIDAVAELLHFMLSCGDLFYESRIVPV